MCWPIARPHRRWACRWSSPTSRWTRQSPAAWAPPSASGSVRRQCATILREESRSQPGYGMITLLSSNNAPQSTGWQSCVGRPTALGWRPCLQCCRLNIARQILKFSVKSSIIYVTHSLSSTAYWLSNCFCTTRRAMPSSWNSGWLVETSTDETTQARAATSATYMVVLMIVVRVSANGKLKVES